MKIRNGFVSNSSSSSFIIGVKGELTDRNKLEKRLVELFGVNQGSWLYGFAKDCASLLAQRGEKFDSVEQLEKWDEREKELIEQGWIVFSGSVHSDAWDSQAETYLVDFGIDYESDDLIFQKGAGF